MKLNSNVKHSGAKKKKQSRASDSRSVRRDDDDEPTLALPSGADAWNHALRQAKQDGLVLPDRPEDNDGIPPSLPEDITDLDDMQLVGLMRLLVAWQEYTAVRLARAETVEAEAATAVASLEAVLLIKGWGGVKEDRVGIAKARRDTDPKLVELRDKYDGARAFRKLAQALYEGLERKSFVVSRELTRRVGMEPVQRRRHKHGGA